MAVVYLTTNLINNKKYIGVDKNDNENYLGSGVIIKLAIKKYGKENFKKDIIESNDDISFIFEREKFWIKYYDAVNSKDFYNISEGGLGGNMLLTEDSIRRYNDGIKKSIQRNIELRKGKTYDEIYGEDRSVIEKNKRRVSLSGRTFSEERNQKISNTKKGNTIPWNKGLDKTDDRIRIGVEKRQRRDYIKEYVLIFPNCEEKIFKGKEELETFIKNLNEGLVRGNKINVDYLIKDGFNRGFKMIFKK